MIDLIQAAPGISALIDLHGRPHAMAGNSPLVLDDPHSVWMVATEHVEIFSVGLDAARADGRRYHFFTAVAGDLLFGLDPARGEGALGLLAVGVVGTRLLRLERHLLQTWARAPELAGDVALLVDRWISGLATGVTRRVVPKPRADHLLEPAQRLEAAAGSRLKSRAGVIWLEHTAGSSLFIGMEDLPDRTADALIPVTPASWLQTLEPSTVTARDTCSAIADDALWRGLDAYSDIALRCEFINARLAAADELNRLTEKAQRSRRMRTASLLDLASVMSGRLELVPAAHVDDPLLAVCRLVGARMGVHIHPPPPLREGERTRDPLGDIVRASRIRSRSVLLNDKWFTKDSGPLIGYRGDDRTPVALLPSGGSYDIVDPLTLDRERVTRRNAATIQPTAVTLYRPFPNRSLSGADLFRFAAASARRADLLLILGVGLASGSLGLLTPYFTGTLVDTVIPEASRNQLLQLAIILGVASVSAVIFDTVQTLTILRVETLLQASVQPALWDRLLGLPVSFFRRYSAGDLAQRVMAADQVRQVLSTGTVTAIMSGIFSLFLFAQLFYYDVTLALVSTGVVLTAVVALVWAALGKLRLQQTMAAQEGTISGLVLQLITGIPKLRVAGAEGRAFAMWAREFATKRRAAFAAARIDKFFMVFVNTISVISSIALFAGVSSVINAAEPGAAPMSAGTFIAFNAAATIFLGRVLGVATALISVMVAKPLYDRARPLVEAAPEIDESKIDPGELGGGIEVSHLSFRYQADGPLVLNDVSLRIEPGECVAVVGPSGSGKSTLLRLLLGLEVPDKGAIYYEGKDLSMLDVRALRRRIGVVMQNNKIRAGTIFQNIVGASGMTQAEAWEAVRLAGFEADLNEMPMGMHTVVQQGGGTLSGGQRQRLLIARAIANKPRILFFDEATSALDNRTQAIVTESLQRLQATRVIIAHRLSTIVGADRIYVLAAGRVVESGTYVELAAAGGLFAELIKRQLA